MAGITLAQAEQYLAHWLAIELALGSNKSVTIGADTYTRFDLPQISAQITTWNSRVEQLTAAASGGGRTRMRYGVPA